MKYYSVGCRDRKKIMDGVQLINCLVGRTSSLQSKKAFSSIELILLRVFAFDFAIVEEVLFFLCLRVFVVWMFELISLFDSLLLDSSL
ncbi:hypothetical protein BpHYR1_033510 [Brachionus plicatilis]|uniref:Uncharacterized protein n=1 Tax=Brachionus plicatilis TaxID=10195 RepID=A0A3M7QX07_BRAPC|nr:hypothetical protein BpHYR1_033510 [Brachionus plicatilis]